MDPCELRLAEGRRGGAEAGRNPHPALRVRASARSSTRYNLETPAGRAAALDEAAPDRRPHQEQRRIQHEVAVQLAGMLGILDTQFVVKRVGPAGPLGPRPRRQRPGAAAAGPSARRTSRRPRPAPLAAPPSTSAAPPTAPSASCSNSPSSAPSWSPRPSTRTAIDEFTAPPYAAVRQAIIEAGGAEYGVQDPQEYLARVREAAPDDTVRALVTELAVEAIMRRTVDERVRGRPAGRGPPPRRRPPHPRGPGHPRPPRPPRATRRQLAAVQNELWVLQQYGQALRERGAAAL